MEDNIFDKVHEVDLKKTMETSERYRFPCPPGCEGRSEAGTEKNPLLDDRTEQRSRQTAS